MTVPNGDECLIEQNVLHNYYIQFYKKVCAGIYTFSNEVRVMKMSQVKIDMDREDSPSYDVEREEMKWLVSAEVLIKKWKNDAEAQSKLHKKKGRLNKFKYAFFGVPSTLIPIIIAGTNKYMSDYPIVLNALLIMSGVLSGIVSFFNFGARSEKHFIAEVKLVEFVNEIDVMMSKPKRHRVAADVYLQATVDKYNSILENAPDI